MNKTVFLLLIITTVHSNAQTVEGYRCFVEWMGICDNCVVKVRHVGLQLKLSNGQQPFAENLGAGTEANAPRSIKCFGNCFYEWKDAKAPINLTDLLDIGGKGYKAWYGWSWSGKWNEKNNCYDSRDRMLKVIGDGLC